LPLTPTSTPPDVNQTQSDKTSKSTKYVTLCENDKARIESLLYIIDKFGVSDEFIHELTMITDGLPKSYLVKQCRTELNSLCKLTGTPGKAPGAQYSFKELLTEQIKIMVSDHQCMGHTDSL
jgi:hypothetical protein